MILVDTSVLVELWRKQGLPKRISVLPEELCICGIIRAELLHGARSEADLEKVAMRLSGFPEISVPEEIWGNLGKNLFLLRRKGITIPFQDALIATIAMHLGMSVWTKDNHFLEMQNVLSELQILLYKDD